MKRMLSAGMVLAALAMGQAAAAEPRPPETLYGKCATCHARGAARAPRSFVPAQWESRMQVGMEVLVDRVVDGYKGMPPMGMCFDCSREELQALIHYMAAPGT